MADIMLTLLDATLLVFLAMDLTVNLVTLGQSKKCEERCRQYANECHRRTMVFDSFNQKEREAR